MIGYSEESKAYHLWLTEEKKVIRSRDVKFLSTFPPEDCGITSATNPISLLDPFTEEAKISRSVPLAEEEKEPKSNPIAEDEEASRWNPIGEGGEASESCPKPNMKRGPGRP